ncbi:MAG: fumarylacetoacetate hydrolase family protein [Myxococcales bacterium]|nr:fumarylacetoacetate hydrolase family protein [Myxococcales bacterium]
MTRYARVSEDGLPIWLRIDDGMSLTHAPWVDESRERGKLESSSLPRLAPAEPTKIVCVGRNYSAHAKELGNEVPKEPLLFFKPPSSLLAAGGTVFLPRESERVEYEAELAVVVGKRGRRISRERAFDHVFGFTIACDVTARDLQKKDGQWTRAKGFDTFCPLGPELVTGIDPSSLSVQLRVNGQLRQDGNTRDMVFDIPALVAFISNAMTLEPGDLILTGTPEGVGPLAHADTVEVCLAELGSLGFDVATEPG